MNRVAFLVDGFNVCHSLRDAERVAGRSLRRLDLRRLCESYARRNLLGLTSTLQSVTYFSAFATVFGGRTLLQDPLSGTSVMRDVRGWLVAPTFWRWRASVRSGRVNGSTESG
jgi:hypothetical protein